LGGGLLLRRGNVEPPWALALCVAGLGALLAIGWEPGEWYTFILHGTVLEPQRAEGPAAPGERLGRLVGAQPRAHRLLDLVVGPADRRAVARQHVELAPDRLASVGDVEDVAGVGVARHQPQ